MKSQNLINYERIAKAIDYVRQNYQSQPSLDELAKVVNLSPTYFQRVFTEWAGTSPKKFLQYISLQHAKKLLKEEQANLFDTALETGLSSTSRLHDLFISIEGMSPAEFKNDGQNLNINYSENESPFGKIIVASTEKGICFMAFDEEKDNAIQQLKSSFENAIFHKKTDEIQQNALSIFRKDNPDLPQIKLHLKGTDFQLKVWESLLKIPLGNLSTYGKIAEKIGNPKASRAVGTAIGKNPIAFLIPCHRVIQANGTWGNYRWGNTRKTAIIGWESSKI